LSQTKPQNKRKGIRENETQLKRLEEKKKDALEMA